ncbi:hypothetical protein [Rahnella selenatireducens]|uniref:hypothetical protein n=1 Tax=Rahnella selenatireducens TaxID=3389797 RepID=UPI0039688626
MEKKPSIPQIVTSNTFVREKLHRANLTPEILRTHCVSVRLNKKELLFLNTLRGNYSKGEWLRMASLNQLPPIVPSINLDMWKSFGDMSQKLNRILVHLDNKSSGSSLTKTEIFVIKRHISELREELINADIWSKPYEGYAKN